MSKLSFDFSDLTNHIEQDVASLAEEAAKEVERIATTIVDVASAATPVRTGYLKSRWAKAKVSNTITEVTNDAPYAGYVDEDTVKGAGVHMTDKGIDAALGE